MPSEEKIRDRETIGALLRREIERHILQAVQRIMVDKGAHGPKIRNGFRGYINHAADFQSLTKRHAHTINPDQRTPPIIKPPRAMTYNHSAA